MGTFYQEKRGLRVRRCPSASATMPEWERIEHALRPVMLASQAKLPHHASLGGAPPMPDAALFADVHGDGPTVVLLHGVPSSPADFGVLVDALAKRHRVLVPHAPG